MGSMEGGTGSSSYTRNSSNQGSSFSLIAPALEKALLNSHLFSSPLEDSVNTIRIADLGCASGANTINAVGFVVEVLRSRSGSSSESPEIQAFFSDLHSNDFNTLFNQLGDGVSRDYHIAGVPGSFYTQLFPGSSIHFSMCNIALQWLSKVPPSVCEKGSPTWNAGKVVADGAKPEVARAYATQAHEDLCAYLACRARETVPGGLVSFYVSTRSSKDPREQAGGKECYLTWITSRLELAWNDLVVEGLITEETRDSYNLPAFHRTIEEIAEAIDESRAFTVVELKEVLCPIPTYLSEKARNEAKGLKAPTPEEYARVEAMAMKSVMKKQTEEHLKDPELVEKLFELLEARYHLPEEPQVPARHARMGLAILERVK